jgi:hypothetical protein
VRNTILQVAHFVLKELNFLLVSSLVVVRLADLRQQIRATTLELFMMEFPVSGFLVGLGILDSERITLNLAETVEIQLTYKAAEVVVLEELWNNFGSELLGILDNKGITIFRPEKEKVKASASWIMKESNSENVPCSS